MRPFEIEAWALRIIDQVNSGSPIEDIRVELKSDWPDSIKAARRLAGHANASRGTPILWLIGLDEVKGIVGADYLEIADWLSKVESEFDGLSPTIRNYNIPVGNETIVALYIETERLPFVVKNPVHGQKGGGPVSLEVPWRDGTRIRSARRDDLIRLLTPLQRVPITEILTAKLRNSYISESEQLFWRLTLEIYIEVTDEHVIIPLHRSNAKISLLPNLKTIYLAVTELQPPTGYSQRTRSAINYSKTIEGTPSEIIIRGPGKIFLEASGFSETMDSNLLTIEEINFEVSLMPSGSDIPLVIQSKLYLIESHETDRIFVWEYFD